MSICLQQVYKGSFQRLLLNLCAHSETRTALVKILMEMLMLDEHKLGNQQNDAEPSYRLYACQSHVMYSRPQFVDGKEFCVYDRNHCLVIFLWMISACFELSISSSVIVY